KKKDFEIIFKKGIGFKNSLLALKVIKNNFGGNRFGFIVSQKVSKKAIVRNKVRRRLAEIIKVEFKNIKNGLNIVIISLPGIETKEFFEIRDALRKLLIKAGIINNS
ncbi:MAG: ribonuclease P protein component, partial [Patescibacteria group bacterium]